MQITPYKTCKSAVVFLTHILNEGILQEFRYLKSCCSSSYEVFLLYETSLKNQKKDIFDPPANAIYTNFETPNSIKYSNWQKNKWNRQGVIPGNVDFLFLDFYLTYPGFDFYWILEYDVRFTGRWNDLFDHFSNSKSDLLTTTLRKYDDDPGWYWWFSISAPANPVDGYLDRMNRSDYIAGFMPILRISNKAFVFLDTMYQTGWAGHHEAIIPTLLSKGGYSIEDIGGTGEFVKQGNENKFYTGRLNKQTILPKTFDYRPSMRRPGWRKNMLWHPVKGNNSWINIWWKRIELKIMKIIKYIRCSYP